MRYITHFWQTELNVIPMKSRRIKPKFSVSQKSIIFSSFHPFLNYQIYYINKGGICQIPPKTGYSSFVIVMPHTPMAEVTSTR